MSLFSKLSAGGWGALHEFGNSKLAQSSTIWVIVLPPIASALNYLYKEVGITLTLPTNLFVLYFGGLAFAGASLLFKFLAPKIVKHAPTYSAYMLSRHSSLNLKNWYHDLAQKKKDGRTVVDAKMIHDGLSLIQGHSNLSQQQANELMSGEAGPALLEPFWWKPFHNPEASLPQFHEKTLNAGVGRHPVARWVATILYTVGVGCFLWVFVMNLTQVYRYLMR